MGCGCGGGRAWHAVAAAEVGGVRGAWFGDGEDDGGGRGALWLGAGGGLRREREGEGGWRERGSWRLVAVRSSACAMGE